MTPYWTIGLGGLVGTCLGSFAATAALRALCSETAFAGRSRCDGCGVSLGFARTIPLVSYAAGRGGCHACGGRIDPLHPIGELAGATVLVSALMVAPFERALPLAALGLVLVAAAIVDARSRRLPDGLTAAAAVLCAWLAVRADAAVSGAIAAAVALVLLEGVRRGFLLVRRRPGLGFGDVKLISALAFWLGAATPWMVVAAAAVALAAVAWLRPADGKIAFGPMICVAAWIVGLVKECAGWLW